MKTMLLTSLVLLVGLYMHAKGEQFGLFNAFRYCGKLTSATFTGNAPIVGEAVFDDADPDFTIYYSSGASGFTHPQWHGYPTSVIETE
jgi:hypothetical protein